MPKIEIKGQEYEYLDSTVIEFVEGLIGLPRLKKAVLVENPSFRPFLWLAAVNDHNSRFIVVEAGLIFPEYKPVVHLEDPNGDSPLDPDTVVLAVVNVSSEWTQTTVNLRAPILLNPHTRIAAQVVLSNSKYKLAESLPA